MNADEAKDATTALKEVKEDYLNLRRSVQSTIRAAKTSKE
jgi:hypothetical protein